MNLFDKLVNDALKNKPELSTLQIVVEKELLHHEILKILNGNGLLKDLTFIGGTCLRCCYGGIRLSEDLDFTGGNNFDRHSLSSMKETLIKTLQEKYGFTVNITEPKKDTVNVDTWKVKIETRPQQKHIPTQRINIDICTVPSYDRQPMMLINHYGLNMGTSGLILQAQSREEIYADKLVAFALRPNRLKYRDVWDIMWLHQQGIKPKLELIPLKLHARHWDERQFFSVFEERKSFIENNPAAYKDFQKEMLRFLPKESVSELIEDKNCWTFITFLINDLKRQMEKL